MFNGLFKTHGFVDKVVKKNGIARRAWLDIKIKGGAMEQAGGTTADGDAAGSLIRCGNDNG